VTVAVVVDSTSDIPEALRTEYNISVVPLMIVFGSEALHDGIDITTEQFYQRLTQSNVHPSTSQPSPGAFAETYERLAQDHDGIISIHLGSGLSGTVRAAEQARELMGEQHPNVAIHIVDSGSVSMGFGFLALEAAKMAHAGKSLDEISAHVESLKPKIRLWAVLDTLKYLERGGRIGRTRAFLGTLLNVKPMIQIKDSEVLPSEQVRTHKKAIARMVELASNEGPYEHLAVLHSVSEPLANELADRLGAIHPRDQIIVASLTGVVGVHGGPGVVGVTGIKKS
jgi:DegV family protein with EDD domain